MNSDPKMPECSFEKVLKHNKEPLQCPCGTKAIWCGSDTNKEVWFSCNRQGCEIINGPICETIEAAMHAWNSVVIANLATRATDDASYEGYKNAFYEIGAMLDIPAMPETPKYVYENVMKPRMRALIGALKNSVDKSALTAPAEIKGLAEAINSMEMELAAMWKRPDKDPTKKNLTIILDAARAYSAGVEE